MAVYKIAVLDDDETWNTAIERFFRKHGFEVKTFTRISDFLNEAQQFDLALIDFYLSSSQEATSDLNRYAVSVS